MIPPIWPTIRAGIKQIINVTYCWIYNLKKEKVLLLISVKLQPLTFLMLKNRWAQQREGSSQRGGLSQFGFAFHFAKGISFQLA